MPRIARDIRNPEFPALLLVCRAQRPITLEVEVPQTKHNNFADEYSSWTNVDVTWAELCQSRHALDMGRGKWGVECRIYFVKDQTVRVQLERYGCFVENGDVRHRGTFRVNSKSLFRELVQRHGLRLGRNT